MTQEERISRRYLREIGLPTDGHHLAVGTGRYDTNLDMVKGSAKNHLAWFRACAEEIERESLGSARSDHE